MNNPKFNEMNNGLNFLMNSEYQTPPPIQTLIKKVGLQPICLNIQTELFELLANFIKYKKIQLAI